MQRKDHKLPHISSSISVFASSNNNSSLNTMSDNEKTVETTTPSAAPKKLAPNRLGSVCSNESFEANLGDDSETSALASFLERLNPTIAHRNAVLRKPGTKQFIMVDEIDEESVSMAGVPRDLIRGRSVGAREHLKEDLMSQAQVRAAFERDRSLFGSDDYDSDKEFSCNELGRMICPEGFHRFQRVGALPLKCAEPSVPKSNAEMGAQGAVNEEGECEYEDDYDYEDYYENEDELSTEDEQLLEGEQASDDEQDESCAGGQEKTADMNERHWSDESLELKLKFARVADRVENFDRREHGHRLNGRYAYLGPTGTRSLFW